jgi:hypothetical protein
MANRQNDAPLFQIFSDPKLYWMQKYSVITNTIDNDEDDNMMMMTTRWSLTMLTIDNQGIICDMQRDIDPRQLQRCIAEGMTRII